MKSGKQKQIFLLIIFILALASINYNFLDEKLTGFLTESYYEVVHVDRVIDGDTIVANNGSIRLLGINTPERGEKYHEEAKKFLEKEIFKKSVELKFGKDKKDLYGRTLAYVFLGNENINLNQIKNGFANFYFPSGKDEYYNDFKNAWEKCIEENRNLCEKSENKCSECIELKEFDYKNQKVVFYNKCDFSCDLTKWEIKDEGRKKFVFPLFILDENSDVSIIVGNGTNSNNELFWTNQDYVWTRTGDTLFLRDEKGKLV
ncbi:MAG: thermonuclease family protein, partial [Nanoarchaeota archaeon]